jgi:hypothetical protein
MTSGFTPRAQALDNPGRAVLEVEVGDPFAGFEALDSAEKGEPPLSRLGLSNEGVNLSRI